MAGEAPPRPFEVTQYEQARITRRNRLLAATVRPLHYSLDAFERVRHQVRIDFQFSSRRAFDRFRRHIDFERACISEHLARRLRDFFTVGMNSHRLFDGVARMRADGRHALLAVFDRSDSSQVKDRARGITRRDFSALARRAKQRKTSSPASSPHSPLALYRDNSAARPARQFHRLRSGRAADRVQRRTAGKRENSFSAMPISPSSVEPMTASFQVVMLSASLNFNCARPCLSVSSCGCQTRFRESIRAGAALR